jgi:hypothetical protein
MVKVDVKLIVDVRDRDISRWMGRAGSKKCPKPRQGRRVSFSHGSRKS